MQKLRTGLESISFSPFETTQLFKQFETNHLARLRSDTSAQPTVNFAAPPAYALSAKARELAAKNACFRTPAIVPALASEKVEVKPVEDAVAEVVVDIKQPEIITESTMDHIIEEIHVVDEMAKPSVVVAEQLLVPGTEISAQSFILVDTPEPEVIVEAQQADAKYLFLVNNITQGAWFEMQGEAGERYRCRLAAIIRPA